MSPEIAISRIQVSGNLSSDCTLLFSNLFNLFPNSFGEIMSCFESRFRIVLYNDAGYDETSAEQRLRHKSLAGYADDLIAWLEENKLTNIVYVAHSVNGLLAFIAADKAPHLFKKIVLTSAVPSLLQDAQTQYLCGFETNHLTELFNSLLQKKEDGTDDKLRRHPVQLTDILCRSFSEMTVENAQAVFDILVSTDCRVYLNDLTIPTMILQASADNISTHEAGYLMYRNIPNSQFVRIKARGHLPQVEAPDQVIRAMIFFIQTSTC